MAWDKSNIESEEILAEAPRRSYELIRITRLKYKDNSETFIDVRLFQRGWDEETVSGEVFHPTKKGVQFKEKDFQRLVGKWTLVPSMLFHPSLLEKAWPAFQHGELDTAVFKAFRAVEVAVRVAGSFPPELVGVALVRKAFEPQNGVLADTSLPVAEQEAKVHLFAGAIGLYKNPHSHREVEISFNQAFEMLLLASHLLNLVEEAVER